MNKSNKLFLLILFSFNVGTNSVFGERRKLVMLYQCSHSSSINQNTMENITIPSHLMTSNQTTIFSLQASCSQRHPNCHAETKCLTENIKVSLKRSILQWSNSDKDEGLFTKRGLLRVYKEYFNRNEYCVNWANASHLEISFCKTDCGKSRVCVPKCCSIEKGLHLKSGTCQFTAENTQWKPLVYQNEDVQICGEKKTNLRFHYKQHIPTCEEYIKYTLKTYPNSEHRVRFRFLRNGSVLLKELQFREWKVLNAGDYCLDGIQDHEDDQILITCLPRSMEQFNVTLLPENASKLTVQGVLYIMLLFSGTPFLLVTVVVYILLWQKNNVHGWTLFSHTLAMLMNYFCQGLTNTVSRIYNSEDNASISCTLIGIANHGTVLASFCWLTMINYDLWSTFRHLKNTIGQSRGVKRFMLYMLFAWGLPLIAVIIGVSLDKKYGLNGDDADCEVEVVIPLYGHRSCYIVEEARPFYLYYPIAGLMAVNLTFAILTMFHMYKHTHTTQTTLLDSTSKHRKSFKVLANLFVVMGLVFMLEIVVWRLRPKDDTLPWYLIFPDVLNLFQAIAIFVLFTCQSKVIDNLWELYPKLRPFLKEIKQWPCYNQSNNQKMENSSKLSDICGGGQRKA